MPTPGKCWYHIILNTHGSWLPGDPRGFRSKHHKRHSSGDYKHPPPRGEHVGLHRYAKDVSSQAVVIKQALRSVIGKAIYAKINEQHHKVLAMAVGSNHAHLLVELPNNRSQVKQIAGTWKQISSHKVREALPGQVWATGGDPIPIKDRGHQLRAYEYILNHRHEGAWVWSFKDE